MLSRTVCFAGVAAALLSTPIVAQELDPALGADALGIEEDGRVLIRNGDADFVCALVPSEDAISLGECEARATPHAALAELIGSDWKDQIGKAMRDQDCKLSTLSAVAKVIEDAAASAGVPADEIDDLRTRLSGRVDEAIDRMLWEGTLTVRDGELALDACP